MWQDLQCCPSLLAFYSSFPNDTELHLFACVIFHQARPIIAADSLSCFCLRVRVSVSLFFLNIHLGRMCRGLSVKCATVCLSTAIWGRKSTGGVCVSLCVPKSCQGHGFAEAVLKWGYLCSYWRIVNVRFTQSAQYPSILGGGSGSPSPCCCAIPILRHP